MEFEGSLEVHFFSTFFFILALSSFLFLGNIIKFIKSLHPFLKKHNALSRTIGIVIIVGLSRIIGIPVQNMIEDFAAEEIKYDEIEVLHSFFIGKTIAICLIVLMLVYFSK